jgi:hypothetical protein
MANRQGIVLASRSRHDGPAVELLLELTLATGGEAL